jgi:hypothetical protein
MVASERASVRSGRRGEARRARMSGGTAAPGFETVTGRRSARTFPGRADRGAGRSGERDGKRCQERSTHLAPWHRALRGSQRQGPVRHSMAVQWAYRMHAMGARKGRNFQPGCTERPLVLPEIDLRQAVEALAAARSGVVYRDVVAACRIPGPRARSARMELRDCASCCLEPWCSSGPRACQPGSLMIRMPLNVRFWEPAHALESSSRTQKVVFRQQ